MTYDDWKLASDRENDGRSECEHKCAHGHLVCMHLLYDDEGRIPRACERADAVQPDCETCCEWVWNVVCGVSEAAETALEKAA